MPPELREDELDLARWLRPGDGVVAGQACAEPTVLVDALLEQAPSIGRLRAFFGLTWRDSVPEAASGALEVTSYGALGRLGRVDGLRVVPCHFSALPALSCQTLGIPSIPRHSAKGKDPLKSLLLPTEQGATFEIILQ